MIPFVQRQLAEFVDREQQMHMFCELIEKDELPIMVIWGDGGLGKSSLLAKMIHECALRNLVKSEITWTDTRNYDYLAIMRKIRDDLGPSYFNAFTDLINYYTVPTYELKIKVEGAINVAQNATITSSNVGNIAGVIIDQMIVEPRKDLDIPEEDKRARLTDCFIGNFSLLLKSTTSSKPIIIFFDAVEKISEQTRKWIWSELFTALSAGQLFNIRFVLSGREEPPHNLDRSVSTIIQEAPLQPLQLRHIEEYLAKRGIGELHRHELAKMLFVHTKGNPLQVALGFEAFLKLSQSEING